MAYYNPGFQPYYPQMQQPVPQPAQPQGGINWVQGESGAKSYLVTAGSSVILMDSEGSCFYIKSADSSGMPLPLRIFDYKERTAQTLPQTQEFVTRAEFDALVARLDSKKKTLKEAGTDGKPDI